MKKVFNVCEWLNVSQGLIRLACILLIGVISTCHVAYGETEAIVSDKPKSQNTLSTLTDLIESMDELQKSLNGKKSDYKNAETDDKKAKITDQMNEIIRVLEARQKEFESIAVGTGVDDITSRPVKAFDLQSEIQEIFRPFIEELKNITSHPRELERLRKEITFYEKQLLTVQQGLVNAKELTTAATDQRVKKRLLLIEKEWQEKEKELTRQLTKSKFQLEQKIDSKKSIVKVVQGAGNDFFKTRGINLLLVVLTFFGVFILFRLFYWWVYKLKRSKPDTARSFYSRLFQVCYHFFTFFIAVSSSLFLLYSFGDWMLLSLSIIFFIGIAWTARNGIAIFWEQAKYMLNIGTVRDGERLVYDGVPWQVTSLNLLTTLENPELQGGLRRLPLNALTGLQSRPYAEDELWFPTRKGDFVVLADNSFGKVVTQTPEMVTLEVLGGCRKTYPCSDFLGQNPINLSINNFGVSITFGIDYDHQALVTREIPDILHKIISQEIVKEEFGSHLLDILVQFKEAAASSLDLLVFVKFSGQAAEYYYMIGRALQRITVEACNQHGWGIPFPQITVHNGK